MDKQAWSQLLDKLKNHQITELELNYELFQEPCILQFNLFCQLLQQCQSLKRFTLRNCSYPHMVFPPDVLFNKLLSAIAGSQHITQLLLPNNNLVAVFQSSKQVFFKCFAKLEELDLANNNLLRLSTEDVTHLYDALDKCNYLVIVNLSENGLEHVPVATPPKLKQRCAQHAEIQPLLSQTLVQLEKTQKVIASTTGEINLVLLKELAEPIEKACQRLRQLLRPLAANLTLAHYYFILSQANKPDADKDLVCALNHLVNFVPTMPNFQQAVALLNRITESIRLKKPYSLTSELLSIFTPSQIFYTEILLVLGHIHLDNTKIPKEQRIAKALAFFTAIPNPQSLDCNVFTLFYELMSKPGIIMINSWEDLLKIDPEAYKTACQKIRSQQIEYKLNTAEAAFLGPIKTEQEKQTIHQARALKV